MSTRAPLVSLADRAETERAEEAAREAAVHLHESRARRKVVDQRTGETREVNKENGFARLIREAFGGG